MLSVTSPQLAAETVRANNSIMVGIRSFTFNTPLKYEIEIYTLLTSIASFARYYMNKL